MGEIKIPPAHIIEESSIKDSASFYDDLDVESLDFCELMLDIKKEFDIPIPDDTYESLKLGLPVNDVARAIHSELLKVAEIPTLEEERISA